MKRLYYVAYRGKLVAMRGPGNRKAFIGEQGGIRLTCDEAGKRYGRTAVHLVQVLEPFDSGKFNRWRPAEEG